MSLKISEVGGYGSGAIGLCGSLRGVDFAVGTGYLAQVLGSGLSQRGGD